MVKAREYESFLPVELLRGVDPFILSLLTGKYTIEPSHIASAIIISAGSNNILKSIYTLWFGKDKTITSFVLLMILGVFTILVGFFL